MRMVPIIAVAAACGGFGRGGIDPARFAPHPEWTADTFRISGPAPAVDSALLLSPDEMIEDIAFLEAALDQAWAAGPDGTSYDQDYVRGQLRRIATEPRSIGDFCELIVESVRNTPLAIRLGGERCDRTDLAVTPPAAPLQVPEPGSNYAWHLADEGDDTPVGVLTITHFADPSDPGWRGFPTVLRELAAVDFVLLDLQAAAGDDPRIGFAVLAALGLERYAGIAPPVFRAGPVVDIARANRGPVEPRSRALWSGFGTAEAIGRAAHAIAPVMRPAGRQVVLASVLVGSGCGRACQLVAALAEHNEFHVGMTGWARNLVSFDEPGLVRLPRSAVEVAFPTAWYGPYGSNIVGRLTDVDPAATLAQLRGFASARPEATAWRRKPPLDCATLPPVTPRFSGCPDPFADPAAEMGAFVELGVDDDIAREFLATCPGLSPGTVLGNAAKRTTIATIRGPAAAFRHLAAAPFLIQIEADCPMYPD